MTNGNKLSWPFGVCVCARADCLEAKLTPYNDLPVVFSGYPPALGRCLNFKSLSSNVSYQELVPKNLIASPLMKPYFTPGQTNPPIYAVSRWKDATISSSFSPKGCSRFFIRRFTIEVAVSLKMIFFLSHRYIVGTYQDERWKTWAPRRPSSRQNNTNENSVT